MLLEAYAIKDIKVGEFNTPIFVHNKNTAIRLFSTEVHNPISPLAKFPADYELWLIGRYNTTTGALAHGEGTEFICNGLSTILPTPHQQPATEQPSAGSPQQETQTEGVSK